MLCHDYQTVTSLRVAVCLHTGCNFVRETHEMMIIKLLCGLVFSDGVAKEFPLYFNIIILTVTEI